MCRFCQLPACVKVIVTSRPDTQVVFTSWGSPHVIEPAASQNKDDMRLLLAARLKDSSHTAPADVEQAVDLLQAKSEVGACGAANMLTCLLTHWHAWLACIAVSLLGAQPPSSSLK
jgi:hypothetical protein